MSCHYLGVTAPLRLLASLSVYGRLEACVQASFVDHWNAFGMAVTHLAEEDGHLPLTNMPGHSAGQVLPATSNDCLGQL